MTSKLRKVGWLDSCKHQSHIHATLDGSSTLCGYDFALEFTAGRWQPYRVSSRRGTCKTCFAHAKTLGMDMKQWLESIPERDMSAIPPIRYR